MRPRRHRRIYNKPASRVFSTVGGMNDDLLPIILSLDEYEAIRLADLENMYQSDAAECMNISRQTFGRILKDAHKKVADHLVFGNSLVIKGGSVDFEETEIECDSCGHTWQSMPERAEDLECPECHSHNIIHEFLNHIHNRHAQIGNHCNNGKGGRRHGRGKRNKMINGHGGKHNIKEDK